MLNERSLIRLYEARNGDFSGLSLTLTNMLLSHGESEINFSTWYLADLKEQLKIDKYCVTVLLDIDYCTDLIYKLKTIVKKLEEHRRTLLNSQTQ